MEPPALWGEAVSQALSGLLHQGFSRAGRVGKAYLRRVGEGDTRILGEIYSLKQYITEYDLLQSSGGQTH